MLWPPRSPLELYSHVHYDYSIITEKLLPPVEKYLYDDDDAYLDRSRLQNQLEKLSCAVGYLSAILHKAAMHICAYVYTYIYVSIYIYHTWHCRIFNGYITQSSNAYFMDSKEEDNMRYECIHIYMLQSTYVYTYVYIYIYKKEEIGKNVPNSWMILEEFEGSVDSRDIVKPVW
jgi:hypothetical protein